MKPRISNLPTINRALPTAFQDFHRDFDDMFNNFFQDWNWPATRYQNGNGQYFPALNLAETEKEFRVEVDLPGMKAEDIEINLQDNRLMIKGERVFDAEKKGRNYHTIERSSGQFMRTLAFPQKVDHEKVSAEYKDGVLKILVHKAEEAISHSRKIEVKGK